MQEIINGISDYLKSQNISIEYINMPANDDILQFDNLQLAIKIDESETNKWDYFSKRVNEIKKIVTVSSFDGIYEFVFDNSQNEDTLRCDLETFYEKLKNKYYKVCPKKDHFSLLVKPTHRCNLDCKYCYDKPYRQEIKGDMSIETLNQILKLCSEYAEEIQFIWHGGEPTMVGLQWFENAFKEIAKYPMVEWNFRIMSNGTNLNKEWLDLFDKYGIAPGVSYNAMYQADLRCTSQEIEENDHDKKISEKIEKILIESKMSKNTIGVIDVITNRNYKELITLYEYYKKIGIGPSFNTIFHTPQTEKNELEITAEKYIDELLKYFKHWLYDKNAIYERTAVEMLEVVIGGDKVCCTNVDCRYNWLSINPLGEIYPCDRYYPKEYSMDLITKYNSIEDIFESTPYKMYANQVQKRLDTTCKECGYIFACNGGCNGSAIESSGNAEGVEETYCKLFRLKFNGAYDILRGIDLIHDEDINPIARQLMLETNFYSVRDIKEFIKDMGKEYTMEYDPNNLLKCSEFEIFRGINYRKERKYWIHTHTDVIQSYKKEDIKINEEKRREDLLNYLKQVTVNSIQSRKFVKKEKLIG